VEGKPGWKAHQTNVAADNEQATPSSSGLLGVGRAAWCAGVARRAGIGSLHRREPKGSGDGLVFLAHSTKEISMKHKVLALILVVGFSALPPIDARGSTGANLAVADAELVWVVTTGLRLRSFLSNNPGAFRFDRLIRGLQPEENILGIDFRPATGQLYALGSTSRLYVLDTRSAVATQVGQPFVVLLDGTEFGFDFNPTVDRIRVVSDAGQNLRVHPDTGAVVDFDPNVGGVQPDGNLAYGAMDANAGATPGVVAAAYTNSFLGAPSTVLYDIDSDLDVLTTQNPPNNGGLNTVGSLGIDITAVAGFDISPRTGTAYATVLTPGSTRSRLATVNLATGAMTLLGLFSGVQRVRCLSVQYAPEMVVALQGGNRLRFFASGRPSVITFSLEVRGLQPGESLLGIDVRPATKQLYALGSTSRLYTLSTIDGNATQVGAAPFAVPLEGTVFGFDFNPQVDRVRIVSNTGQNLRVHPDTGAVVDFDPNTGGIQPDLNLAYAAGDPNVTATPSVVAAAYTNNVPGTPSTVLYDIDSALDVLVTQNPPNNGALNTVGAITVGGVPLDLAEIGGFDIAPITNAAFASLTSQSDGIVRLYALNLMTGAATLVGVVGNGSAIVDIAILPRP
jgi:hypothetical protein